MENSQSCTQKSPGNLWPRISTESAPMESCKFQFVFLRTANSLSTGISMMERCIRLKAIIHSSKRVMSIHK